MSVPVSISSQPVPTSFCPSNIQSDWPFLVALLQASMAGNMTSFVVGATTPDVDDQDKPWLKLNADGTPDRVYLYANGNWLARHPVVPGIVCMYEGAEASITTLDSGEAGAVTKISGPMWEKVSSLDARVPIGPGALAVSGTSIAVGGTGGTDQQEIVIGLDNMPEHAHDIGIEGNGDIGESEAGFLRVGAGTEVDFLAGNTTHIGNTRNKGGSDPIVLDQMPPYLGIFFIRRTAREYYRGA